MIRSVSEPSIGTVIGTIATRRASLLKKTDKTTAYKLRGNVFLEGKIGIFVQRVVWAPWNIWWRSLVLLLVVYDYVAHLLLAYYLGAPNFALDLLITIGEALFFFDVLIQLLHNFWPILRLYVRVYKRNYILLAYDVVSLLPLGVIPAFQFKTGYNELVLVGRWLSIGRIYRVFPYFNEINERMQNSRKGLYVFEHAICIALVLHVSACIWYSFNFSTMKTNEWSLHNFNIMNKKIIFNNYLSCWYCSACRLFNCIFGDNFPIHSRERWLTSSLMIFGYVCMRYRYIGGLTWTQVLANHRWYNFIEHYHHMINFLKFRGASALLVEQAMLYKQNLWNMKNGILTTSHWQKLPLPLQMELFFDINVQHFHDSLLLRDTDQSFMRHISLYIKHELYLSGQSIWNQDVVKNGMIFIKRGVIELLSDEDDESPVIAFKEGTVLGEISLFYSIPSKVTAKAASYVELQVLRRTDFLRAMNENPFVLQEIRKKVEARIKSSKVKENDIKCFEQNDSNLPRTRYRPMKLLKDHLAGVEEEDPTFIDDSYMYYKDASNLKRRKFVTEYLELYQLSPNVTTVEEPRICLRATFPWILEPNTDFTNMFDVVHFLMVLYVCIMYPHISMDNYHSDWIKVLNTVVNAGLLVNIYIQITTAITVKNVTKETVREIAEEKMATVGFYLDILSVFPIHIFTDTFDASNESIFLQISILCPILQVWHIWDYFDKWEKAFENNEKLLCVTKFCTLFVIFSYWSGCLLYITACPKGLCRENSWMGLLIYWETKVLVVTNAQHERRIASSFSFGTSLFTGSGTSYISPGPDDIPLVIVLFISGAYLSCFYIAKICSIYVLSTQRQLKFKGSMRELFYFLTVNRVSGKIKSRVKKFFCVQWYYNKAVQNEEIFQDMSNNIQQEILSLEMIETLLYCPLFQDCSRDFLQTVASNSKTIVLPDNEIVQHAGDIGRDMYILKKGHCNMLNNVGKVDSSVEPGNNIGVVEMLYGLPKVLKKPHMRKLAAKFEESKPLVGKIDEKTNRIAQEIKESFVILNGRKERAYFVETFNKLGVMRHMRYFFLPGCITPHGAFLKFWCTVRFMIAIYYVLIVPYNIAIQQSKNGGNYDWADVVLYVDIVLMFYVAYYDKRSLLITHPLYTTKKYLKHAFLLDFISVFPFEELLKIVNDDLNMDLYRLNRILLVCRITGTFSYWESDIMQVNEVVVLLKFLPIALTMVNFATAFIFMNSCKPFTVLTSPNIMVNCTRVLALADHTLRPAVTEYLYVFFWVFETFMGCGCTSVVVSNVKDVWLTMSIPIISLLYFGFMYGYIVSTRSAASHSLLAHNEEIRDLTDFLFRKNVDPILTGKTLRYFEYVWKRTHGSNPQEICQGLNSALMEDTLVFMYERALREVPLFGKVERSFIRVITQHLHEMYFLKGDTVLQCKDMQTNVCIIYRGKVDVLSDYNEMITCMGPGGMFGNFSGKSMSSSEVAIFASRNLDLLVLPSQTFFNLVKYYPKIQEPLNKAFQISKNYILPISMENMEDDSSESESDQLSQDTTFESRSGSSKYDVIGEQFNLASAQSMSNISQVKSLISVLTYQSYLDVNNLLKPGSQLYQGFGYFTCAMTVANYVLILYEIVTLNNCHIIFWSQSMFDIYFYINLYISMHEGYMNRHGYLIIEASKCRARYYKRKLCVWSDLITNFPFELFGFCSGSPQLAMHYLRANKLFRLKYLIQFYRKTSVELTNNLTTLQSAMTVFIVILLIHTFTCVWLLTLMATAPFNIIRTIKLYMLDDDNPQRQWDYTTSFYVIVSELTSTGGDEFQVDQMFTMIILVITLICGKMLAATVIATAMQVAYSSKYALNAYEKATKELIDYLKNQGLSSYQLTKFWKYVRQLWVTERGRQLPALMARTPYVLRCDLMSAMFGQHLRSCYLFADTGEPFLRQLTVLLDYSVYFPGNYIVVAGDSETRMHWVATGSVSVVSVRPDLTETTHELLGPGDVFGIYQGLNRGISHCFSYRAEAKVDIVSLSLDSWINILPYFPEAKKNILRKSELLFTQMGG